MSKKILVVDDKLFLARMIQHHLEQAGYELIRARNSREAVDAVEREGPEVIVMDDATADSELAPVVARYQRAHGGVAIHLIQMTERPPTRRSECAGPAEVVLTRPFSPSHLIAEINRLCCA